MKIKKYEGKTEQEVMQRVKDELGLSAIVLSIKRKPYRGLMRFFRKPLFVLTAAYEEKTSAEKVMDGRLDEEKRAVQQQAQAILAAQTRQKATMNKTVPEIKPSTPAARPGRAEAGSTDRVLKDVRLADQQQRIASLESKLNNTEELLSKVMNQLNVAERMVKGADTRNYDNPMIQLFYDSLVEQGVTREIAEVLLENADAIDDRDKVDTSLMVKIVYNTILDIIGEPDVIDANPGDMDPQIVIFMGPTGVGKTTTIAKISSLLALNEGVRVGLITADTYRIAAVEQLKTYAEILGLDVRVVYNNDEIIKNAETLCMTNEVILVDTAGRSHRNVENLVELKEMLDMLPDCKKYLVLSITTRYEDLLRIVNAYAGVTDFSIIFTKLDETSSLGSIMNICYLTGKSASYVTFGQNVPDDMEIIQPDKITKSLLGLGKAPDDVSMDGKRGGSR